MNPIIPQPGAAVHVRTPIEVPQILGLPILNIDNAVPTLSAITGYTDDASTDYASDVRAARWLVPPTSLNGLAFQFAIGHETDAAGVKATVTFAAVQMLTEKANDATTAKSPIASLRKFLAKYELTGGTVVVPDAHVKRMMPATWSDSYASWVWADTWTLVGTSYLAASGLQSFGPHEKAFDIWSNIGVEVYAAGFDSAASQTDAVVAGLFRGIQL